MLKFMSNQYGSGIIRAKQIAERLGAPCDVMIDPGDILVAVKLMVYDVKKVLDYGVHLWIDVVDGYGCIEQLFENPRMKAIAIGNMSAQFIKRRILNTLVVIPEHHCNFDNEVREDREVKIVGAICNPGNFDPDIDAVRNALKEAGLEFKVQTEFPSRQSVVDFYKSIDIQLCFRYWRGIADREPPELKNPLKLENAGSFKIPTVAFPEPCFVEDFGSACFAPVYSMNGIVSACKCLADSKTMYDNYAGNAFERAKDFHIDKIAPLYRELD